MKISKDTEKLIEEISDFAERPLRNRFEVSVLIETSLREPKIFKDLIFKAKYINGLKKVLSGRSINKDGYMEKIFAEFNKSLEKFLSTLKEVVLASGDSNIKFFEEKYFRLTQESMANVMTLVDDLAIVKEFFNSRPKEIQQ